MSTLTSLLLVAPCVVGALFFVVGLLGRVSLSAGFKICVASGFGDGVAEGVR